MRPQYTIHLLCSKGMLKAHIQPGVHHDSQTLFCAAAFQLGKFLAYICVWGCSSQDFALPLLKFIGFLPFQTVKVSLDGRTTFYCISHPYQSGVIRNLAEGMLCPIVQLINEGIEKDWSRYWPSEHNTSH